MEAPCFLTDIFLPEMLFAMTIRSPIANGRLISIECPQLPGGYTLISASDIPGKNSLDDTDLPILADTTLAYIGEPIALLLGPDKNVLENLSRLCKAVIEEDDPVFVSAEISPDSIAARREFCIGDPDAAFANAASVVRDSCSTGIQEHWYAEPSGAVAWLEDISGEQEKGRKKNKKNELAQRMIVRTATQWPFHVRRSVTQALGLADTAVLVKPTIAGLHMDGKLWYPSLVSCHAALGTWITKKPVRLILTRAEDFAFSPKRCETEIHIASALDEKGGITGIEINASVNLGAYGVNAEEILDHVQLGSCGVYHIKNIRFSGVALRTNLPPQGPFGGFGLAQGFFAIERHISHIADTLKLDPAQWRKDHCIQGAVLPLGLPVKEPSAGVRLIDTVMHISDYRRKWAAYELLRQSWKQQGTLRNPGSPVSGTPVLQGTAVPRASQNSTDEGRRGIGIALGYQGGGLLHSGVDKGSYSIELVLEKDGTLEIKTSMVSPGAYDGVWIHIASEILGIEEAMIRVSCSTDSPDAGPLTASRNVTVIAKLVEQACLSICKKRFRAPLPISVRKTIVPQKNPAWEERFSAVDYNSFARPGWAAAIVEVEIDPIEYLPRIRGVWMSVDGGKIIAEDRAHRSLKTAAVQALGWAYLEHINYVSGIIPASQFDNFDIPGLYDVPPITINFIPTTHEDPKGIGDLPFSCIPAAYLQAVSQATDYHLQSIPIKALDIWYAGIKKIAEGETA